MVDLVTSRIPDCDKEKIANEISIFSHRLLNYWKASGRNKKSFLKRHGHWLGEKIFFNVDSQRHSGSTTPTGRSRILKDFDTASTRTKRRRTQNLVTRHTPQELAFATQTGFMKKGKRNVAQVIRKVMSTSPRSLKKLKRNDSKNIQQYTPEEALALMIDLKLTKSQYLKLRKGAQEKNCKIYPSYDSVLKARKECYPTDVHVTDTKGEIKLQSLLDHIVQRLCIVQNEVISRLVTEKNMNTFEIIYKWGFDGSSSHSMYKQRFQESCDATDTDIFLTSIVPLQMTAKNDNSSEVVWMNPRASSTRFCIPIKLQFIKETQNVIRQERDYIERQISTLKSTCVSIEARDVNVGHTLIMTMLDGKVANALTENPSTQSCYICQAKPKDMNEIQLLLTRPCNINTFQYGLSTLHAHIRFFECILHVAYRLDLKTWQVRGATNRAALQGKKKEIVAKFRQETGLLVDVVKQGSGSTNDGNTARKFFKDPKKAAEITKVDEVLITKLGVILQAISCGYKLNSQKFREYAEETARLFVHLYGWYKMPASMHKILLHGADVMDTLLLPIGQLSEEALEARHKDCRYFREHSTRKMSRKNNIEDLLHALLISSDLVISSLRPLPKRKLNKLPSEVINLVEVPEIKQKETTSQDAEETSEDEESDNELDL